MVTAKIRVDAQSDSANPAENGQRIAPRRAYDIRTTSLLDYDIRRETLHRAAPLP